MSNICEYFLINSLNEESWLKGDENMITMKKTDFTKDLFVDIEYMLRWSFT